MFLEKVRQKIALSYLEKKGNGVSSFVLDSLVNNFTFARTSAVYLAYYNQVAPVGDSINKIATEASSIRLYPFVEDEKEAFKLLSSSSFCKKFRKPNFQQTCIDFNKESYIHELATGNNYIYLSGVLDATRKKVSSEPLEMYNLRPDLVTPYADTGGYPKYYLYSYNGQQKTFRKEIIRDIRNNLLECYVEDNGFGVLVHLREPSTNDYFGAMIGDSPLQSVELEINQYLQASIHNTNLLKHGLTARMLFTPKDGTPPPNVQELQKLREYLAQHFSGSNNSGKNLLIGLPFDVKPLDINLKDMDFEKLMRRMRVAIYNKLNIPLPHVEGEFTSNTNMKESNLNFYDKAVLPLIEKRCEAYYNFIYTPFFVDEGVIKIDYDVASIPALQTRLFENSLLVQKAGTVTINELREYQGLGRVDEGGDVIYIDANRVAVAGDENFTDSIGIPAREVAQPTELEDDLEVDEEEEEVIEGEEDEIKSIANIDLVPNDTMVNNARRGLELRKKYKRGGTAVGVARARDIANKKRLSPSTVARMVSFFARHGVNKGKDKLDNGEPSNHYIAWCLTHDTEILLADGTLETIGNIVNNKMDVEVMSRQEDGSIKPAKIINWLKLPSSKNDFMVLRRGKAKSNECGVVSKPKLYATKEHPIFTGSKYTQMQDLTINNKVAVVEEFVDSISEQIVLGHIMGDAHLSSSGQLKISRCDQQLEYLKDTIRLTSNLNWQEINSMIAKAGFGVGKIQHRTSTKSFRFLLENSLIKIKNKKRVLIGNLDRLNDIAVSRWILDDGSLNKGNGVNARPNYRLHIEGYDKESAFKIAKWFESKYQGTLSLHKRENCDGFVIYFGVDMTQDIAEKIAKYVPYSMRYKLPDFVKNVEYSLEKHICQKEYRFLMQEINYIRNAKSSDKNTDSSKFDYRYDLTIEGTHNFIANSVIVHNCLWGGNAGESWSKQKWEQIKKEKEIQEDIELKQLQKLLESQIDHKGNRIYSDADIKRICDESKGA